MRKILSVVFLAFFMVGCSTGPKEPDVRESKVVLHLSTEEPVVIPVKRVK